MPNPPVEVRAMIQVWKQVVGAAHTASPLMNQITPLSAINNAISQGLTGGVKGALVVDGTFDVGFVTSDLGSGAFTGFTKDVANSFLDTSYFNISSTTQIEVLKDCYFLAFATGTISLLSGGGAGALYKFNIGISSTGGLMVVGPTLLCADNGLASPWTASAGPLMMHGSVGDKFSSLANTVTAVGSGTAGLGTGGVCHLQFLVVG